MTTNLPFLSIIIPCYNVADFLPDTIKSLCCLRNADDCEFLFVNDGSTDDTLSIIEDFARQDKRVIVINKKNAGVSAARNAALGIARGLYILPLDGDDKLRPQAFEIIKNDIKNSDLLLAPSEIVTQERSDIPAINIKEGTYTPYDLYNSCAVFPTHPKLVYKSSIIQEHAIRFDEDIHSGEVYTFTCHFLRYCTSIVVSNHCFYQYVMRETSATHAPNYTKDLSVLTIIDRIISYSTASICELPSFNVTMFRMCTSFTYNKYAKLGLTSTDALDVVYQMLQYPPYKKCLKNVAYSQGVPMRDHILAIFMLTTRIWGYKLLARLMRIKNK